MKYLLSVALFFVAQQAFAQMPPPPPHPVPTISVSGEANEKVTPDQAIITASVVTRDPQLDAAKKNNDAQLEKVVQIAQEFKIPKDKIIPSSLSISPEYTYSNNSQKPKLAGYVVSRTLRIVMDKLDIHERVLSALVDAKIDQVSGVEFAVANPEEISDRLRLKAMENAKNKAAALAAAAGMKLGKPISISIGGGYMPPQPMPMMMARSADMMEKSSIAPSLPGTLDLHESVSVVFAME